MNNKRIDPDARLASLKTEGQGRLTVFLGAAAGVGKTYAMLARARRIEPPVGTDWVRAA